MQMHATKENNIDKAQIIQLAWIHIIFLTYNAIR